jgi:hypothetical protein
MKEPWSLNGKPHLVLGKGLLLNLSKGGPNIEIMK